MIAHIVQVKAVYLGWQAQMREARPLVVFDRTPTCPGSQATSAEKNKKLLVMGGMSVEHLFAAYATVAAMREGTK